MCGISVHFHDSKLLNSVLKFCVVKVGCQGHGIVVKVSAVKNVGGLHLLKRQLVLTVVGDHSVGGLQFSEG